MPLDSNELAELSADVLELVAKIRAIVGEDSDGGKKITRSERRDLLRFSAAMVGQLAIDIVD